MTKKLEGKVALVTGGSRGIGAAIAKDLAKQGAVIAVGYGTSAKNADEVVEEIRKNGGKAEAFQANMAESKEVEELVNAVVKKFGRLDILVNNAGVYVGGAIDDPKVDVEALKRQQAINIDGVVVAVRTAVKFMKDGGRIIVMGSVNGERVPFGAAGDYSATKAALRGYVKGWARDLGPKNITVNLVQPGPIDTDMNPATTEFAESLRKGVALGRYGKPEEVAAAVTFLASPEASYITASALTVDGGFNA
jgi:3-oxoacyl-[acyl-carrier protein] reductase